MKTMLFRFAIIFSALFVIGACSSNDNNSENEQNNNNNEVENEQTENNNNNENETASDNDEEENNENNSSGNEDDNANADDGEMSAVDFEDISFSYPSDAQEMTDMDDMGMPVVGFIIDIMSGTSFNVIAEELPMELTLDEYIELTKENYGDEYTADRDVTINGIDMHEFEGYQDETPLLQRAFIHKQTAYVITYGSMDEETMEEHLPIIDEIMETIELN